MSDHRLAKIIVRDKQITALKAEWDRLLDDFFKVCERNAELMLERDRLREALEKIAKCDFRAKSIARAALSTANPAGALTTDPSASWSAREP